MTLIEGPTLQQQVDDGEFDDERAARQVRDVARAVAYAHRAGIVHRDLKPENILINEDGRPLVTDFGLAKWHREGTMVTRTGQVLGTPHFMSPEQACGRGDGDLRTDVYSLGAILYALLTGQPPHVGQSAAEVLRSVLQDEPPSPRTIRREIPSELDKVCLKAIHFEPEARYQSAIEFADDLDRYLAGEETSASASGLLTRVARDLRRDQHQEFFKAWGSSLIQIGVIIFLAHVVMFVLQGKDLSKWLAHWLPRATMLAAIFLIFYRARNGVLLPRSVAERPVWSIWIGYLVALAVTNTLLVVTGTDKSELLPLACVLSGFGFLAMSGHVWGGAGLFGIAFMATAIVTSLATHYAPIIFGAMWLVSLVALGNHYRSKDALP